MKRVLCPIDFSENSLAAASFAIRFAQLTDCDIKFFYVSSVAVVIPSSAINYHIEPEIPGQHLQVRQEELENQIDALYQQAGLVRDKEKAVCETLDYASIVNGISEQAQTFQAELIIMGTTGASAIKRFFIGSVTTSVIDQVQCPVLAVPSGFDKKDIKKIGMPTDVVNVENEILDAVEFAQIFSAELNIFHVSVRQPKGGKLEDKLQFITGYPGITYSEIHPQYEGDVIGGLNYYVELHKPDLLIMHHTHRNWFDKLISGSRTKNMIFHSEAAILIFNRNKPNK